MDLKQQLKQNIHIPQGPFVLSFRTYNHFPCACPFFKQWQPTMCSPFLEVCHFKTGIMENTARKHLEMAYFPHSDSLKIHLSGDV